MTKHNGSGGGGSKDGSEGAQPRVDVVQFLRDHGFKQKIAWFEHEGDSTQDGSRSGKPKSAAAEKKSEQRVKDRENGWAECHAKAPDDSDARMLVSLVAKSIKDENVRAVIWLAIRYANTVFLGEHLIHLGSIRRFILRSMIMCLGASTNRPAS